MTDAVHISLSGMQAQKKRLLSSAANIANLTTSGAGPQNPPPDAPEVFRPLSTAQKAVVTGSGSGAGVSAQITQAENGTTLVFDPSSPFADENGMIAVPEISLEREIVNLLLTKNAYKANALALKTAAETEKELLNTLA